MFVRLKIQRERPIRNGCRDGKAQLALLCSVIIRVGAQGSWVKDNSHPLREGGPGKRQRPEITSHAPIHAPHNGEVYRDLARGTLHSLNMQVETFGFRLAVQG